MSLGVPRRLPNGKANPEYMRRYYLEHKEYLDKKGRDYTRAHAEENRKKSREYYWSHRERQIENSRRWAKANPERVNRNRAAYLAADPEHRRRYEESKLKWLKMHPRDRHQISSKSESKRERGLPTNIILGGPFEGAHLHHLTPNIAIYIPDWIHRSIYHNIWTGQNMAGINSMAWAFYQPDGEILPI